MSLPSKGDLVIYKPTGRVHEIVATRNWFRMIRGQRELEPHCEWWLSPSAEHPKILIPVVDLDEIEVIYTK